MCLCVRAACVLRCVAGRSPSSRAANVAAGRVMDTPAFQWLDAHEARATVFALRVEAGVGAPADGPLPLPLPSP